MSTIIAGRFDNTRQVQAVLQDLAVARFKRDEVASYYVNPPGQYGLHPLGGEWFAGLGMQENGGAAAGGAAGIALGGPAGALASGAGTAAAVASPGLGAYAGALHGSQNKGREDGIGRVCAEVPMEAGAGPMVAICIDRPGTEQVARAALNRHGAHAIERQEGRWEAGDWKDFEPASPAGDG